MAHKIGGLLLAAGMSKRAGPINKLLAPINGTPMIVTALDRLLNSKCDPVIAVTGHEALRIEQALIQSNVQFVHNPDFASGMASSLRCGVLAMPEGVDAILITLADMPHIKPSTYEALINGYAPEKGHHICVPIEANKHGNPVLIGRNYFAQVKHLQGDKGGKPIIEKNPEAVLVPPVDDPGIHQDHDTV